MSKTLWLCAAATIAIGCAAQKDDKTFQAGGDGDGSGSGSGSGGPTSATGSDVCANSALPAGTIEWQRAIDGGLHVVADAQGNVVYTTGAGIVKLDADGNRVFAYPFGDVVAVDAAGDVFVAGVFTSPIDLGRGVISPVNGNDVFVVELSPSGELLLVQQGLCTANILPGVDTLLSIAVAADGRIALSGMTFGVVVLDAQGELIFQTSLAGLVAFDAAGDLVVSARFGGSGQLQIAPGVFIQGNADYSSTALIKYDVAGNYVSHTVLDHAAVAGLVLDRSDNILVIAETQNFTALPFPQGVEETAIAVKLTPSYDRLWAEAINSFNAALRTDDMMSAMGGIATNAFGDLIVSSNEPVPTGAPYAIPVLTQFSAAAGGVLLSEGARGNGFGLGVAADTCGNIYYASVQYLPNATTLLQKIVAER